MPRTFTGLIALALTAAAMYFGTGLHPHWWLTWIATVPVLGFAYGSSARAAFFVALFGYLAGELNLWGYFKVLEIPVPVRCVALFGFAAIFAAGVLFSRTFYRRGYQLLAAFALPTVFVAFEFANYFGRNGTALNLAYSQMDCLPLLQLAAITGVWGISFFVLFFSSALTQLLLQPKSSRRVGLVAGIALVLVCSFGFWRLHQEPHGRTIRIGLAASDQRPLLGNENNTAAIIDAYTASVSQLVKQGATVIVLPEKIFTTSDYLASDLYKRMHELAIQKAVGFVSEPGHISLSDSIVIVAGVDQQGAPLKHNLAFAVSPLHRSTYEKHHLVVGWEDGYEVGSRTLMLPFPNAELGVAICKDMDFPDLSRRYSQLGAQLMLVPAWDFEVDDWLHSRMAIMRSVESGFAMARSAKQGLMTINDNRGRVLFQSRSDASGDAHLLGTILISADRTLYSRLGNWFAWLDIFAVVLLVVVSLTPRAAITDN